ncbi:GTP pyrophosphokinase [Sphingomonas spermidinifaciens]|nr:hypothetical protein [Sphingomonas spermidinifaciens]
MNNEIDHLEAAMARYAAERPLYESYAAKLQILLTSLLEANEIRYQVVESRAKDLISFRDKINRPGKSYKDPLTELPDLCGARVIVYYSDDVTSVSEMIDREFLVLEKELSHQPDSFEVDRFGYLSVHSIVRLNNDRSNLSEWKFAESFKAEIQIRTVIQHAWSAVSHALQYKQETATPSKLRRRLFRIAGLFELADEEFVAIRDAKVSLTTAAVNAVTSGEKSIPITLETIKAFVQNNDYLEEIVEEAKSSGFEILEFDPDDVTYPEMIDISNKLGLQTISEIESIIKGDNTSLFASIIDKFGTRWSVSPDYLIFFILLREISSRYSIEELGEFGWGRERAKIILSGAKNAKTKS